MTENHQRRFPRRCKKTFWWNVDNTLCNYQHPTVEGAFERLIMYNNVHFGDNFCIFNHTLFQDLRTLAAVKCKWSDHLAFVCYSIP